MLLALASLLLVPQSAPKPIAIELAPSTPDSEIRVRWSPKGAKVPLKEQAGVLAGSFLLGPKGAAPLRLELSKGEDSAHYDRLAIDFDRDGVFAEAERLSTTPNERRGKWWSSFSGVARVPMFDEKGERTGSRPYPMNLWFVVDPVEPQPPVIRWCRRGFHEGRFRLGDREVLAMITERRMDGVFDQRDSWQIGFEPKDLSSNSSLLSSHCWLDGVAYRSLGVDPDGRSLRIEAFDPGFTEEEERERKDVYKADREAARAEKPMQFGHDLTKALVEAKKSDKLVFVDFETTWCGPCKQMDQLVYTAKAVVEAASGVVAVKLDGDEERELKKKYEVAAFPTMLILDADGKVLDRAVGYRGVAAMVAFLSRK